MRKQLGKAGEKKEQGKISRRKFLKDAGIAAGGVIVGSGALVAAAPAPQQATPPAVAKEGVYSVVKPLGEVTVKQITMAPRLDTLDGKTVCEVTHMDLAFKSSITFPIIRELLKKKYPTIKIIPYTEMPLYDRKRGDPVQMSKDVIAAMKAKGCDAVISGNGG